MKIVIDQPVPMSDGVYYTVAAQHRSGSSKHKSIWIISYPDEVDCFRNSYTKKWYNESTGWGLLLTDEKRFQVLGRNSSDDELFISKFIDGNKDQKWHGYPADYRRNSQDRPPEFILYKWREEQIIDKSQMKNLKRGKKCILIKMTIYGDFWDCQIYSGKLYLWTMDGTLEIYDWDKFM